jgi:hypothetical protein
MAQIVNTLSPDTCIILPFYFRKSIMPLMDVCIILVADFLECRLKLGFPNNSLIPRKVQVGIHVKLQNPGTPELFIAEIISQANFILIFPIVRLYLLSEDHNKI